MIEELQERPSAQTRELFELRPMPADWGPQHPDWAKVTMPRWFVFVRR